MAVIDASVQVALLSATDPHHEAATLWYRHAVLSGERLLAPFIIVAEVAAAISRGLGDAPLAHRATQHVLRAGPLDLVPVDGALAVRAAAIAADHRIRGCDAVYVALAAERQETLVTLDAQQSARAAAVVTVSRPGAPG
jgi:predicted nucleic acid-binding protein